MRKAPDVAGSPPHLCPNCAVCRRTKPGLSNKAGRPTVREALTRSIERSVRCPVRPPAAPDPDAPVVGPREIETPGTVSVESRTRSGLLRRLWVSATAATNADLLLVRSRCPCSTVDLASEDRLQLHARRAVVEWTVGPETPDDHAVGLKPKGARHEPDAAAAAPFAPVHPLQPLHPIHLSIARPRDTRAVRRL